MRDPTAMAATVTEEPRPPAIVRLVAEFTTPKAARGVGANFSHMATSETIEAGVHKIGRDLARLLRQLQHRPL
jgi:hypothetical protein